VGGEVWLKSHRGECNASGDAVSFQISKVSS
jgi:hypothetical protein